MILWASGARQAEGLAQAHEDRIDLLLTDVVMSGRNGHELYNSRRTERRRKEKGVEPTGRPRNSCRR